MTERPTPHQVAATERKPGLREQVLGPVALGADLAILAAATTLAMKVSRRTTRAEKIAAAAEKAPAEAESSAEPRYRNISELLDTGAYQPRPPKAIENTLRAPQVRRVHKIS